MNTPPPSRRFLMSAALILMIAVGARGSLMAQAPTPTLSYANGSVASEVNGTVTALLKADKPEVGEVQRATGTFTTLRSGDPLLGEEGAPALPIVRQWVAVPSVADPAVTIRLSEPQPLPSAAHPLDPVPYPVPVYDDFAATGTPDRLDTDYSPNPEIYNQSGWYPAEPVTVGELVTLRGQKMRQLQLTTVQVNLETGELRWFPSAAVALDWQPEQIDYAQGNVPDPQYENFFQGLLSNYEAGQAWRADSSLRPEGIDLTEELADGNTWMIRVREKGVYRIPLSELAALGVDVSAPERLVVYTGDRQSLREQAIWIANNELYFINTLDHGRWSYDVVFRLKVLPPGQFGKRMASLDGTPNQPTTLDNVPYQERMEKQNLYQSLDVASDLGDRWHWGRVVPPNLNTYTDTFDLPFVAPGDVAFTPGIGAPTGYEYSGRCNEATFGINGYEIFDQWYGAETFEGTLVVPSSAIQDTGNDLSLVGAVCGTTVINQFYLTGMDIAYQRYLQANNSDLFFDNPNINTNYLVTGLVGPGPLVFEVGDPDNARVVISGVPSGNEKIDETNLASDNVLSGAEDAGPEAMSNADEAVQSDALLSAITFGRPANGTERYVVTSVDQAMAPESITFYQSQGLIGTGIQTDYIVIAPAEFNSALLPLMNFHRSQGLTVRFVSTQDIYNDFGDGTASPEPIRAFMEYAYNNWPGPQFSYVLLVGDSSYDPLNYLGAGADYAIVPAEFAYRDIELGEVPSDNEFVADLDGSTDDLPDAHIGRMPAKTVEDVEAMVSKTVAYANASGGPWQRTMLFVSDNSDSTGDFNCLSEWLYQPEGNICVGYSGALYEGRGIVPQEALVVPSYLPQAASVEDVLRIRDSIVNYVNGPGALVVQYIGHGARIAWAGESSGVWSLYRRLGPGNYVNDLDLLTAEERFPFVLPWTCWEGYFVNPYEEAIAEESMRNAHGWIGSLSPVGLDVATAHDMMAEGFFKKLHGVEGETPSAEMGELALAAKANLVGGPSSWDRLIYTYMLYGDPAIKLQVDPCLQDDSVACAGSRLQLPLVSR
ncbi:MAG: hypothetical protein H6638_08405 [Ardenticatenales bacterium]|nr:hypothetical protein [Ardenticatenales bacterium]MCB9171672.1 hypothetical protein [Ardenticatenales bacterium]